MRPVRKTISKWLLAAAVMLAGCSSEEPAAKAEPSGRKAQSASGSAGDEAPAAAVERRSQFSTNVDLRDPFFPNVRRRAEVPVNTPRVAVNAEKLLRQGFQGIFGAGGTRLALINNVMLETGRTAAIPVRVGNRTEQVAVRVREIRPTSVVLELTEEKRTITISTAKP